MSWKTCPLYCRSTKPPHENTAPSLNVTSNSPSVSGLCVTSVTVRASITAFVIGGALAGSGERRNEGSSCGSPSRGRVCPRQAAKVVRLHEVLVDPVDVLESGGALSVRKRPLSQADVANRGVLIGVEIVCRPVAIE